MTNTSTLRHASRPLGITPLRSAIRAITLGCALATPATLLLATQAQAQSAHSIQLNIPAGPLGTVLSRYAAAHGIVLSFDASLTANRQSPGIQGATNLKEGFKQLLQGSGLAAEQQPNGDYILKSNAAGQPLQLLPVQVNGRADNPVGPISGYLATSTLAAVVK